MNEIIQVLLIAVVTILTSLIVVISLQVLNILKEFQRSIEKANKILDNIEVVSNSIVKPASSLSGLLMGIKNMLEVFALLKKKKEKENNS